MLPMLPMLSALPAAPAAFGAVPPPSEQASAFFASLGWSPTISPPPPSVPPPSFDEWRHSGASMVLPPPPPPMLMMMVPPPPPPPPRQTGFDVLPQTPGGAADARSLALEIAKRMADAFSAAAAPLQQQLASMAPPPPKKTLDELFARERARIAAAEKRNLAYVAEQQEAAKARAKAAACAAKTALSATSSTASASSSTHAEGASAAADGAPAAKVARLEDGSRLAPRSAAGGAAACSVYVAGLPRDAQPEELELLMTSDDV